MQTGQDLRDVLFRHQIIIGDLLAEAGRGALEAIKERALVKARVVDIQAGIDDGDPAACAGVAVGPGVIGADHRARRSRVGLVDIRLVLIFHIDALNAVHGADRLHLAVGHTRGNAVHADGELVAHGKRHAELRRNGLDLRALLLLQAVTVGQCRSVAAEAAGRIAVLGQGIAAEADDHTHRFLRRGLVRCVRFHMETGVCCSSSSFVWSAANTAGTQPSSRQSVRRTANSCRSFCFLIESTFLSFVMTIRPACRKGPAGPFR